MTYAIEVGGSDHTAIIVRDTFKLGGEAHAGESGQGGFSLDDDNALYTFPALKIVTLTEDASGAVKHLARGRVNTKELGRGFIPFGDARQFQTQVMDSNADLRGLRVHGWDRPQETDVARVQDLGAYILNGSSSTVTNARKRASTVIDVATYVPNTNTVTMPPHVYDTQDPWGVLDDCARMSGKAYMVLLLDDGSMALFYDLPTSTAYASTLSITDDAPDGVTEFAPIASGAIGTEDGGEFLSGAGYVWGEGSVATAFDAAAEADHDVWEVTTWDGDSETEAAADIRVAELIERRKVEERRYRFQVKVPRAKAHLIKYGMTISFRSAAAGILEPEILRVARCDYSIPDHDIGSYTLDLELGFPEKIEPRIQDRGRAKVIARQIAAEYNQDAVLVAKAASIDGPLYDGIGIEDGVLYASWDTGNSSIYHEDPSPKAGARHQNRIEDGCGIGNDAYYGDHQMIAGAKFHFNASGGYGGPCTIQLGWQAVHGVGWPNTHPQIGPFRIVLFIYDGASTNDDAPADAFLRGIPIGYLPAQGVSTNGAPLSGTLDIKTDLGAVPLDDTKNVIVMFVPEYDAGGYTCGTAVDNTGGFITIDADIVGMTNPEGPGWYNGPVAGVQDGANQSFTVPTGYGAVREVTVNGIELPSSAWSATDGSTITFIGWAPEETDQVLVKRFIP